MTVDYQQIAKRIGPLAQRYCSIVESARSLERADFLLQVYRTLPEMIREAIALPEIELRGQDNEATEQISRDQWFALKDSLKGKFGDWDLYWVVYDPTTEKKAVCGSLADDVADIYRDVREASLLPGDSRRDNQDVIWEFRLAFHTHWGMHAMSALKTLHFRFEKRFVGLE
jgi:uncharacterized protein DUF5063